MNIAHPPAQCFALVTETYPPQINGVSSTLGKLCQGLLGRSHRVQLIRPAIAGEKPGLRQSGNLLERRVRGLPIPGYPGLQWGLPARRKLKALWSRQRPDAVYLATEGPLGWSALRLARRMKIPVISGFHTNFQQYSNHFHLGLLHDPALRYLRWFHNQTQLTLVASSTQQRELSRLGVQNLALLGRGVDCTHFHPAHRSQSLRDTWGASAEDTVLLHVGRLSPEKNPELLIECWNQVKAAHANARGKLFMVIVGDGPSARELRKQMPDATFAGALTGEPLASAYASADIFVFPSLTETFGNVVTEAMASGLAVCAFDTAAAHQHIQDRYSGCLAPPSHDRVFIDNLNWLIQDVEGRRSIRLHARHRACQLDWQSIVQRFERSLRQAALSQSMPAQAVPSK
ncbi:MAG: glycosyltransferase family 1 protein [Halopseudomonas sp.]|uniref:glycosyltransferase family 4 protein n=1 Tax=Halopseudomonas sp. TaxID=2901191 RepID=UPI0030032665